MIGRRGLGYKERIPDWLRVLVSQTLQEEGNRKSNWKIWSDLKKLTVPDCRAFVPQRVKRRVKDPPSGLNGLEMSKSQIAWLFWDDEL